MKIQHIFHRLFLISMVVICAIVVVSSMKQAVNAQNFSLDSVNVNSGSNGLLPGAVSGACSDINGTKSISEPTANFCLLGEKVGFMDTGLAWRWYCAGANGGGSVTCSVIKIIQESASLKGTCSSLNGTSVAVAPTTNFCATGTQVEFMTTNLGWSWRCKGINNGESASCSVTKTIQTITSNRSPINGACSNINGTKVPTAPMTNLCFSGDKTNPVVTNLGWSWYCKGINGGTNANCNVIKYVQEVNNTNVSQGSEVKTNIITETILKKEEVVSEKVTPVVEKEIVVQNVLTATEQEKINTNQAVIESSSQDNAPIDNGKVVISQETVIQAQDLLQINNPKISGVVDNFLKIEHVQLNQKENGNNRILLTGKAWPNALVTIYIFSNDPVVITVKTDANGNWSYELNKELADGGHEAYVAVTSDKGEVISKSEPIAFIKIAQAATMIPAPELTANQSPIERSMQQYILIAIMIMMACLVVALSLIGFLNHKYNLDEGISQ